MEASSQDIVDEATFEFTMGDHDKAIDLLTQLIKDDKNCFEAHHALAEIYFDQGDYKSAREAGEAALKIREDDIHLHTTMSRIWMESGDKDEAEKHGARARVLGWKEQLKSPPDSKDDME